MRFDYELVGKIGSMALIRKEESDIDYNIFSRLGRELKPGMIWVSSGATEIGRLDYIRRTGEELSGDVEEVKVDYAAQGQIILMSEYRRYVPDKYSIRQLLVEHTHFNDEEKRAYIRDFLLRAAKQNAIPIVNYNDPVSSEEIRKMELAGLRANVDNVVECIDNDETASVICSLVHARYLVILTNTDGIYQNPFDPSTLVPVVEGKTPGEVVQQIDKLQSSCIGTSRIGARGAHAKLDFIKQPVLEGTTVMIANGHSRISDILAGTCPRTVFRTR